MDHNSGASSSSLPAIGVDGKKRRVAYFYDPDVGDYYYGGYHLMKPHRIRITHELLKKYKLLNKMHVFQPILATTEDLQRFHDDEYVEFLSFVTPENKDFNKSKLVEYNMHDSDCPVFYGVDNYCRSYAGASICAARKINDGDCDIAINWSGGLHHSKKDKASGFCYVNDIVLAILKLLEVHQRVLYVDIDVHHGDGVEEAFYTTDRVMTVSFHKFGNFFPGTGDIKDIGYNGGKYYSLNVPLEDGIDDESYQYLFKPIIRKVFEVYRPSAVVLQCGADSLSEDQLGTFNLSIKGHAECVEYIRSFNLPLLLLGGGGYTIKNVARCWCYETAVALGVEISDEVPKNKYIEYFGPEYCIHVQTSMIQNRNSRNHLDSIKAKVLDNLSQLQHAPSAQFQEPRRKLEDNIASFCAENNMDL